MASADETLYDRVFNLYGTNIDPQDWDFNINDGVAADLSDTMGEGWENPGSWDFVGDSFDIKDWWRGVFNQYWSSSTHGDGLGDPSVDHDWGGEDGFESFWDSQMLGAERLDEDKYLGYWKSPEHGEESLSKLEYRMGREGTIESALKGSKKFQHGVGKKGFAGGSKGGIVGDSSMWDEFIKTSQDASRQFAEGQRGIRDTWLQGLIDATTMY